MYDTIGKWSLNLSSAGSDIYEYSLIVPDVFLYKSVLQAFVGRYTICGR